MNGEEIATTVREILDTPDTTSPEYIREKIQKDPEWTERAILALWRRQTEDEKRALETKHRNNVGFNSVDAGFFTYCANWLNSGKHLTGSYLQKAQRYIGKYSGQLHRIAVGDL